eukprot:120565-Pyramimonas_sp.AAC.1
MRTHMRHTSKYSPAHNIQTHATRRRRPTHSHFTWRTHHTTQTPKTRRAWQAWHLFDTRGGVQGVVPEHGLYAGHSAGYDKHGTFSTPAVVLGGGP